MRRRLVEPPTDHLLARVGGERRVPRQTLEENAAERVHVGARVDRIAEELLGTHVLGRADHEPALRQRVFLRIVHRLGDAEVDDLGDLFARAIARDDDVVGLEIAVDDAELVRGVQSVGDLAREVDRAARVEGAVFLENGRQRLTVDVLHHEVDDLVRFAVVEDRGDVRMQNASGVRRLARESL